MRTTPYSSYIITPTGNIKFPSYTKEGKEIASFIKSNSILNKLLKLKRKIYGEMF